MIDSSEPVVRSGVKQFGCVGRLALNAKQNIECSSAGWRNRRSRTLSLGFHSRQYDGSGRRRGEIRVALHPELLAGPRTITANELSGRGPLLPFQLHFEKFDRGLARRSRQKDDRLPASTRTSARPGRQAPPSIFADSFLGTSSMPRARVGSHACGSGSRSPDGKNQRGHLLS